MDGWMDVAGVMEGDEWEWIHTGGGADDVMARGHTACGSATYDCLRKALLEENAGGAHDVQHVAVLHQRTERVVKQLVFCILIVVAFLRPRPLRDSYPPPLPIRRPLRTAQQAVTPQSIFEVQSRLLRNKAESGCCLLLSRKHRTDGCVT